MLGNTDCVSAQPKMPNASVMSTSVSTAVDETTVV